MDMQWLDDVLVLLEEGNMTRAAARRNITQPAFSRRIRGFEDWLGLEVLDRQSNRIDISPSLRANEGEIRALVARLRELRTKIARHELAGQTVAIAAQHAPVFSTFPDMALRAKQAFPAITFRMRAGNLSDCMTMFLRGDTSMLLCYEAQNAGPLEFGPNVVRGLWGRDYLVPLVGGALRRSINDNNEIPEDTPAVVYPDNSYFGEVLRKNNRIFGTPGHTTNPVCETAFSAGAKEMALRGLGVAWLPLSMTDREIESGEMISLASHYGREPLEVAIYADERVDMAATLIKFWAKKEHSGERSP